MSTKSDISHVLKSCGHIDCTAWADKKTYRILDLIRQQREGIVTAIAGIEDDDWWDENDERQIKALSGFVGIEVIEAAADAVIALLCGEDTDG